MSFAQVWLQAQRFHRFCACLLPVRFGRLEPVIDLACDSGESRMRERKVGIEGDGLLIKFRRTTEILEKVIGTRLILARSQIKHVSVGVFGRFGFNAGFFLRRKCCAQGIGDFLGHFTFNTENIG